MHGPGNFAYFGERLANLLGIGAGDAILDIGTGRGAAVFAAARRAGSASRATGIDISPGMVAAARDDAAARGLSVDLEVMDAEYLAFEDERFDCVICAFGIMFFPDRARAFAEMRRVLRPQGRLGVSTWTRSQADDLAEVLHDSGFPQPHPPGWVTKADDLAALLSGAGFRGVEVRKEEHTFRYVDIEQYWQNARGTGVRAALDSLQDDQIAGVRGALGSRLARYERGGHLEVPARALLAVGVR